MLDVFVLMLNKDRLDARRIVDRSAIIGIKLDTTETDIYIYKSFGNDNFTVFFIRIANCNG